MVIGIIGAGISGLVAARALTQCGHAVWLLDKGRGVGGRMATRRVETNNGEAVCEAIFDHGAQFFTARTPEFSALIDEMIAADAARQWYRGYPAATLQKDEKYPRFCGARAMTAVPKYLSQGLNIHLGETVRRLTLENGAWRVDTGNTFRADALILTPPVPQSLALLEAGNILLPPTEKAALARIEYEPCWAVMAQLDGPSRIPPPGALHVENETLSWLADNHQKGVSPLPGSVTIHATGAWTQAHYNDEPGAVAAQLISAARDYLGNSVLHFQTHRWRYAKPLVTHDAPCLSLRQPAPLVFAGDAFVSPGSGPRVEAAALAGFAAAQWLAEL